MEARTAYLPTIEHPRTDTLCPKCGMPLGYETTFLWQHHKRGKIESKAFVRTILGKPVCRLYVRGEVECKCGQRVVWRG